MAVGEAKKLEGIFTPLLVPLDERDRVNEAELRRFVSWLIERGVHGVYPNGSTGEFTRFTAEERRRSRWWRKSVAAGFQVWPARQKRM
jgi:4-hydroxy-tetrahydrodipicolinate synthase